MDKITIDLSPECEECGSKDDIHVFLIDGEKVLLCGRCGGQSGDKIPELIEEI